MDRNHLSVELRVNGRKLREFQHEGEIWVEGRTNSDYVIRVRNDSDIRVVATPSVDGLSVMDGKEASYHGDGYIIGPRSYIDIPGWRLDDENVAKFRFGYAGESYAAKKGKPRNIGVIGVAFFNEKQWPVLNSSSVTYRVDTISTLPNHSYFNADVSYTSSASHGAGGMGFGPDIEHGYQTASSCCADEESTGGTVIPESSVTRSRRVSKSKKLGTEFGGRQEHAVVTASFTKASRAPENVFNLRYATREELIAMGVDMSQPVVAAKHPNPFPAEQGCTPPEGWNG